MRASLTLTLALGSALVAPTALPCGMGYGAELVIEPSQQILLAHREGVETYVFSPHFCGQAADFGLILPVPAALTSDPVLAQASLFDELDELTAPRIVEDVVCVDDDKDGLVGMRPGDSSNQQSPYGVDVVDAGQVGIFDWTLLQAQSREAFTSWLDASGYPYDADATAPFDHYVDNGWYFVAFKVTAAEQAPPAGKSLCGDLGPISLSFPVAAPVIPARITATADSSEGYSEYLWQVFTIAERQLRADSSDLGQELLFSATLTEESTEGYGQIRLLASMGERLTKLNLSFWGDSISDDIMLEPDPDERDFRAVVYQTVYDHDCGGCTAATARGPITGARAGFGVGLLVLTLGLVYRRRAR